MSRVLRAVTSNWKLKAVALVVACGMWVGVVYARNPPAISTVQIPLQQTGLASTLLVLNSPSTIAVKVAGIRSAVDSSLVRRQITAEVDLSSIHRPGQYTLPLHVKKLDPNVELWSAPASVSLNVDAWASVKLPVLPVVTEVPPVGYTYSKTDTTVSPATVTVRAPSSLAPGLKAEAQVNLSGVRSSTPIPSSVVLQYNNRPLSAQPAVAALVSAPHTVVTVNVAITAVSSSTRVAVYVVTTGQVPSGYQLVGIATTPPTVVVSGPSGTISGLVSVDTQAVNLSSITGDTTLQVALVIPAGVTASATRVTVTVTVQKLPQATPSPTPSPTP